MPKADRNSAIVASKAHPFDALPFVRPPMSGDRRCFWAPRPTGDYTFDCALGGMYADAMLKAMRENEDGMHLLTDVVTDMMSYGKPDRDFGLLVGMMSNIGPMLKRLGAPAEIVSLRRVA